MTSTLTTTTTAPIAGSPYLSPEELTNIKEVFQIFTYEGSEAMRKDDLRVALRVLGLEVSHQQYLGYCALFTTTTGRSVSIAGGGGGDGEDMGEASMGSGMDGGGSNTMRDSVMMGGGPGASVMAGSISASSNAGTPTATRSNIPRPGRAPGASRGPIPNTFSLNDFIEICIDARDSRTEVVKANVMEATTRLARGGSHANFDYPMKDPTSSSSAPTTVLTSRGKTIREAFSYCDESGEGSLTPKNLERMLQDLSKSVAICNTAFSTEALVGGNSGSSHPQSGGGLSGIDVPSEAELTALLQDLGIDPKTGMTEEDLLKILSTSSSIL